MTPEQLAEIEARAEAATPAPWYDQITDSGYLRVTVHPEAGNGICGFGDMEEADGQDHYNAAFIAKAREDVPALIAEIKRLRDDLDRQREFRRMLGRMIVAWREDATSHYHREYNPAEGEGKKLCALALENFLVRWREANQ